VASDDGRVEILQQPDAAGAAARVRGQLEKVDRVRNRQRAREVGEEDGARLQRCDEQRLAAGVGVGELAAELRDAALDLAACEIDVPDRVAVGGEASG
jgi:hypothetical protein